MAEKLRLPKLAANVEEATVGVWRKRAGDNVSAGEPVVEIITSKATFDLEAPAAGVLKRLFAPEKSVIPVGYVLAVITGSEENFEDLAAIEAENDRLMADFRGRAVRKVVAPAVRATPGARRVAREAGCDLSSVPLPPGKDILREEDVRQFLASRQK